MKKKSGFISKIIVIIIVIAVLFLYFIFKSEENREIVFSKIKGEGGSLQGELSQISVFPKVEPHEEAFIMGENLLLWQGNKVLFISPENEKLNEREVLLNDAKIYEGRGRCIIFGKGDKEAFLFNDKGDRIEIINTGHPIVAVKDLGRLIGVIERSDRGEILEVFSPEGNLKFKFNTIESHIGDFSADFKNEKFLYSEFSLKHGDIKSVLKMTDFSGELLEQTPIDNIILKTIFNKKENGNFVVLTKDDLFFLNEGSSTALYGDILSETEKSSAGKIIDLAVGKSIGILTEERFIETSFEGRIINNLSFLSENKIKPFGDGFLIWSDKSFSVVEKGKILLKESGNFTDLITNGNIIIAFSEEGARWYKVKYVLA